jgi:hypothetical protein
MAEKGISRNKLLKRAGVVGVGVWSVPFLASTASADVGIDTLRQNCRNADNSIRCPHCGGSNLCTTKNGTQCFCFNGVKNGISSGCCECQGNFFCSSAVACNSNSACPSGQKCVSSCCNDSGFGNRCAPKCGQGVANGHIGSGLTAAG